jgi:hypothetical protein
MLIGRTDGAVAERHHDRQAETGGVVDRLRHEQEALARRRRIGARAGRRSTDRDREGRELRLDVDEFAVGEFAGAHHFAETLDDVRLRGNRIGADHFGAAQRDSLRHRA